MSDFSHLFTLRVSTREGTVVIRAYENPDRYPGGTHTGVDLHVRQGGKDVFPRGALYIGIPGHQSIDGDYAKRAALNAVATKPGDTDAEFFADYSADQLAFVSELGEELGCIACDRYGDD